MLDDESIEKLWTSGVLGSETPYQLQDSVLFLLRYHCALCAQREHYNLRRRGFDPQIVVQSDGCSEYLKFVEDHNTKMNQGGLKHCKVANRVVCVYPSQDPSHCPMKLYHLYISKLPETQNCAHLYLAVATAKQFRKGQWYCNAPMGINNIGSCIKNLCKEAGLQGFFMNHSLCVRNTTNLYNSGIPKQVIQENTGHRSIEVLRSYKVTSVDQKKKASNVLSMQYVKDNESDKESKENVQKVCLEISVNVKQ